jgi:hypothetical protein
MRLDVFKYLMIVILAALLLIFVVALTGCTMYSIKMDHPEGTEFDNTDKRSESAGAKKSG